MPRPGPKPPRSLIFIDAGPLRHPCGGLELQTHTEDKSPPSKGHTVPPKRASHYGVNRATYTGRTVGTPTAVNKAGNTVITIQTFHENNAIAQSIIEYRFNTIRVPKYQTL